MSQIHPLTGFNGLRALACLSVIFYHLNQHRSVTNLAQWNWDIYQFIEMLSVAVSFFFILSAISNSLSSWRAILRNQEAPSVKKTFIDRFFRIAPAYYVTIIFTFLLVLLIDGYGQGMLVRFLSGLTFLSWVSPTTFFPVDINGPLWFIAYDMMGAILVIGSMGVFARIKKVFIPFAYIGIIALLFFLHFSFISIPFPQTEGVASVWFPEYNPFIFGIHFMVGVGVSAILAWQERQGKIHSLVYDFFFIAILSVLTYFLWDIREAGDLDYSLFNSAHRFPFATILIGLILFVTPSTRYIGKWLDNHLFHMIARLSYSVYLWHAIVIVLLTRYLFSGVHDLLVTDWIILSSITLISSFSIAWLSYNYIEIPVANWWRKYSERNNIFNN